MVTVADVLSNEGLDLEATAVIEPGRPVRWVATSELIDPTPYLEGGELLLTTGLETAQWTTQWHAYVERLDRVGVSALGLGVGLTHQAAPPGLVRASRYFGLNLLQVPRPTTFVSISLAIARLVEAEQESVARHTIDVQRTLTQAALRLDDTSALLTQLGRVLGGAAVMLTRDGFPNDGPFGPRVDTMDLEVVRREVSRIRPQGFRAAASVAGARDTLIVRPLGLRDRPDAYLAALVRGRPFDLHRAAVNTAVSLMSLSLESRNERRATDRNLRGRALELLLGQDVRTAKIVLGATSSPTRLPSLLRVVRARGSWDDLEDALSRLEGLRLLAMHRDQELVLLAPAIDAHGLGTELTRQGLQAGIGHAVRLGDVLAGNGTAAHSLAETTPGIPLRSWDELVEAGPIGLLGVERARSFAGAFLAPLRGDQTLLITLHALLRHHGSRGEMARELGIHRNTVRNRIESIEALIDASLDDPQVRVSAWIAVQVDRAMNDS